MTLRQITLLSLAACALLFAACNNLPKDQYIDAEFKPYTDRFFSYARQYGLDVEKYGLHIEFADLGNDRAGQCFMDSRPVYIQIDRDYWYNVIEDISNSEDVREDLIFHEMGHGFLNRGHTNGVLDNSDWQSIMCGDELPHGRSSNINYRGFRKEYYIDELFNAPVDKPSWSSYVPDFSKLQEQSILHADGTDNTYWYLSASPLDKCYSRIENGQYTISNNSDLPYIIPFGAKSKRPDISDGVYFSASLRAETSTDEYAGIAAGQLDGSTNLYYLRYNNSGMCIVGETSCSPFLEIYKADFSSNTIEIGIRANSDTIYLYLNGSFLYHFEMGDLTHEGNDFGFVVPPGCTLYVDNAELRSSSTYLRDCEATEEESLNKPVVIDDRFVKTNRLY